MNHGRPNSQPTDGQSPPQGRSPWTRPWFIASAAAVVLIVALGIAYAMVPSGGHTNAAPAPTLTATAAGTAGGGQESACGLPAGDQRYPSIGLPTRWELLGRVAVPTDPHGIGPGRVDGTVRTCYQHSPTGALYAAANIIGTGLLPGGQTVIFKNLAANSPMRDQALATPPTPTPADPSLSMQIGGFKLVSYTGDTARIALG
ncbi:hypothetical protein, partial [Sinomonas humi]|uniref:hypothetical protein n=1 Tax=Sinomonas humi TaxID=1338436 RepID=UPI00068E46B0